MKHDGVEPATLTISEVADRTGVAVSDLRNWEARYGLPRPGRTEGGQRRYRESDCRMIEEVLRLRDSGLSLRAAIEAVGEQPDTTERSLFAGLRRLHPELPVHTIDKRGLLALTWAVEDECLARAQSPLLIGAFQQIRFFESAKRRWAGLAATGQQTIVFADFEQASLENDRMALIPFEAESPLRREWALICDSTEQPACVLGWEPPGQEHRPDSERTFEMIWSVDPQAVRRAARIGVGIAAGQLPGLLDSAASRVEHKAREASPDLKRASGVFERAIDYLVELPEHTRPR